MRSRISVRAALLVTAFVFAACSDDSGGSSEDSSSTSGSEPTGAPSGQEAGGGTEAILAVVQASGGSFEGGDGDTHELTLEGVPDQAVWFADRPARRTGSFSIPEMNDAFFGDQRPPNAALEIFEADSGGGVVVVEVSEPQYDAGAETLRFDARVLEPNAVKSTTLAAHADRAETTVPAEFGTAALFIDDATTCYSNLGEVTDFFGGINCEQAQAAANALGRSGLETCNTNQFVTFTANGQSWECDLSYAPLSLFSFSAQGPGWTFSLYAD